VVDKFVLQLEAQLGDRQVTIELAEDATKWLIKHGYDEHMGARPMARLIQETIKKPLADEVLFGKLKSGGHVRVMLVKEESGEEKLGFEFPEGPVTPKPEKIPIRTRPKRRPGAHRRNKPPGPRGDGGPSPRGSVPKVPLVKV
jgi:ATP-dependent Clp protease ATP-binding subunit ClpA